MGIGSRRWAVVLGGGDGTRLQALTTARGVAVPKQFCSFHGGPSLLERAVRRARRVAGRDQVLAVVAAAHRAWWVHDLAPLPEANVVVQPANRGTAAGVLLPLAVLRRRDPRALVAILPSDHYVRDEAVLERLLRRAFRSAERDPRAVVLLGVEPDAPDTGYGWILPGRRAAGGTRSVRAFVEKPPEARAVELMRSGGVWNSFLLVAAVDTLWRLYERHLPRLAERFAGLDPGRLDLLYAELGSQDFSRDLLQPATHELRLVTVPECGWSDLGTPARLAECVARTPRTTARPRVGGLPLRVDLAHAV